MVVVPINVMWGHRQTHESHQPDDVQAATPALRPSLWQWMRAWYLRWRQPSDIRDWDQRIDSLEAEFDDAIVTMLSRKSRRR